MNNFEEEIHLILESKKERMIDIRRYLHAHPELSFKEQKTAKYIAEFYQELDCKVEEK